MRGFFLALFSIMVIIKLLFIFKYILIMKYSTIKRLEKLNYVYLAALLIATIFG